jgi:hypothetical protein
MLTQGYNYFSTFPHFLKIFFLKSDDVSGRTVRMRLPEWLPWQGSHSFQVSCQKKRRSLSKAVKAIIEAGKKLVILLPPIELLNGC